MAQIRIHELPAKSLPLDGTEVLALDEAGGGEPTAAVTSQGVADLAPQGDALTADPLSQFAATASAQFFSVVTDATGTGLAVGNTSPTLITPDLGTPSALDLANATGLPWASVTGTPTTAVGYGITNGVNLDDLAANAPSFYLDRANHTGTQASTTISDFDASTRAQVEGTLVAGANVTITPAGSGATRTLTIASTAAGGASDLDGLSDVTLASPANGEVLLYNGGLWVNAAPPGGGGGTVTEVTGGAGLTGTVTTTGSLDVGAGTGITVNPDDIEINRAIVDTWYVPAAQARQWDGGATGLVPATGRTSLELGTAAQSATGDFAPAAEGVTNGNSHDHSGGDGAQIAYGSLSGLPTLVTGLDGLSDVVITAPATDQVLKYNGSQWVNDAAPGGGGGTVTSVGLSAPVGFDVTGTPVTTAGTIALAFTAGYSLPTDALQADWSTAFTQTRQWDGGATGLVPATGRASLELGTAAQSDVGDFATPAEALQWDGGATGLVAATGRTSLGLGTAAQNDTGDFATPAELATKTQYIGEWVPGTYPAQSLTIDQGVLAIANKSTSDKPAPQAHGPIDWFAYPTPPTFATLGATASTVFTGLVFTPSTARKVSAIRTFIPVAGPSYQYAIYRANRVGGLTSDVEQIQSYQTVATAGAQRISVPTDYLLPGNSYLYALAVQSTGTNTTFSGTWTVVSSVADPSSPTDGVVHSSFVGGTLKVTRDDASATDRTADLSTLGPGSTITIDGTEYSISLSTPTSYGWDLTVSPLGHASTGSQLIQFSVPPSSSLSYFSAAGAFSADPEIAGYFNDGTETDNNDGYGIDVEVQDAVLSDDWDLLSIPPESLGQNSADAEYIIELGPADADQTQGTIKSYTVTYPGTILTDQDMARIECQIEAPAGAPAIYDVLLNGTTILDANQIRIDAGEVSSATSATPAVWTSTALAKGDVLTFEIIQAGVTAGKGPVFYLPFRKSTN